MRVRRPDVSLAEGWRISFGRVFHRNGAAKENERFPVFPSLTDDLKRVTTNVERVDLWLVGMVRIHAEFYILLVFFDKSTVAGDKCNVTLLNIITRTCTVRLVERDTKKATNCMGNSSLHVDIADPSSN